jgi:hypothetical protein
MATRQRLRIEIVGAPKLLAPGKYDATVLYVTEDGTIALDLEEVDG